MYSLDFAAEVSRICMDEIRQRGLNERKILRKSVPNSVLLLKVFRKQNCTANDLKCVSIHSVATLMQDTLWCCQERIVPKKVWRVINYETCTLSELSQLINKRGEKLLIEILDFLVDVMRYKRINQMDAYHLGEAMGKVTLGPADCDPIIAEKAGHFLTRMIIDHSKRLHGIETFITTKSEAAHAKAKSYNRSINKIRKRNEDWMSVVQVALFAMLEHQYEAEPVKTYDEPYLSIFSKQLDPAQATTSPLLFRLVTEATKAVEPVPKDPFADSPLFSTSNNKKRKTLEHQIKEAFDDFMPLLQNTPHYYEVPQEKTHKHLKMMNKPFLNKISLRKPQKSEDEPPKSAGSTIETESYTSHKTLYSFEDITQKPSKQQHHQMKNMMKKVIKIGTIPTKKVSQIY